MNSKSIRVLHVLGSLNMGGTEVFVMNMYRNINKKNMQFDFAIFSDGVDHFELEVNSLGGKVFHFKQKGSNKYWDCLMAIKQLRSFLKSHEYEIIHVHGCSQLELLRGSVASKLAGCPIRITHSHSVGTPQNNKIDNFSRDIMKKLISSTANYYFACSDLAASSKYTDSIISNNKAMCIHNAIDLKKFAYDEKTRKKLRADLALDDSSFVLGHIGRFEKEKNHKFLIELVKRLSNQNVNFFLILVGDGSMKKDIEKIVDSEQLNKNVILVGQVANPADYYQVFDLFILPSLYEGFPFVAVEAQASGLPSIFSNAISSDVCLSENTKLISLDSPLSEWIKWIDFFKNKKILREKTELQGKGYEITDEATRLSKFYSDKNKEIELRRKSK